MQTRASMPRVLCFFPTCVLIVFLTISCCAALASDDPMQSSACGAALRELQVQEEVGRLNVVAPTLSSAVPDVSSAPGAAASGSSIAASLIAARRQAAQACLGPAALKQPPRQGQYQQPISVPSVGGLRAGATWRPSASAAITAQAAVAMPPGATLALTSCDALGCWASDGSRLDRIGTQLRSPQGLCTAVGAVLNCP
jgi:hypothetical protein